MQRRRLILALTEILAEGGLDGAGVGRICTRASVSRRTFYDMFADREACLLAAFDLAVEQFAQAVTPAFRGEGRWHERIRESLWLLLDRFEQEPLLAWLCVVEAPKGDSHVLCRRGEVIEALVRAVDEGCEEARNAPSPLTAESTVGGALSIIHDRLVNARTADGPGETSRGGSRVSREHSLTELVGPLTSMIVQPYLGPAAARRELDRPTPRRDAGLTAEDADVSNGRSEQSVTDLFRGLPIRFTYRTARVIGVIADCPGANNRQISEVSGAPDQGQISKLLHRLEHNDLIVNHGRGHTKGEPNAWTLTPRGQAIHRALQGPTPTQAR
jgi:AcrR family transcriptional regulator